MRYRVSTDMAEKEGFAAGMKNLVHWQCRESLPTQPGASDYRNPNLAVVMKELGYVQRFGMGIAIARREMVKNGSPPPEFLVEDAHVAVILRSQP